jgi:4-hydroxybenzoyl-CoA thioesterase
MANAGTVCYTWRPVFCRGRARGQEGDVAGSIYPVTVQWGDCDPAGIVYYPNFFHYFDQATWHLFRGIGVTLPVMQTRYGAVGVPLVEVQAHFKVPCWPGDTLEIESWVSEWTERTFTISHVVRKDGRVHLEGREVRFWGVRHPEDPARLKAVPVPGDVRGALEAKVPGR